VKALVLGGGGITGIAWEIGIVTGLADAGLALRDADRVIGTSAGSVVGALVRSELPLEEIYATQLEEETEEIGARMGLGVILRYLVVGGLGRDPRRARARLGRMAIRAHPGDGSERRRIIESRLPVREWPPKRLLITAVDADTGDPMVFDGSSGVALLDAVAASCAVPLVWPPVTINGRRYIDGGARSIANADLASGASEVVVIAPIDAAFRRRGRIAYQLEKLGPGVRSVVIAPDRASREAIGTQVLDPARRGISAQAGREQGRREAARVASIWSRSAAKREAPAAR
jgi:NTE family protein